MTFQMFDEDRARSLAGVVRNDGLWASDRQARYARAHMRLRVNAYYDDQNDELDPEWDDGSRYGVSLDADQVFTKVDGIITFAPRDPDHRWQGREGGGRPWSKVFVLDGQGIVWAARAKFRKAAGHGGWDVSELERVFTRTASGPDHWVEQDEQQAEVAAKRAAEDAAADAAPSGRVEVRGVVLSTKLQANDFGETLKMLVKAEQGFRVWTTVPSSMCGWNRSVDIGDPVHIKVTLTPSDDDTKFAFGKRPAKVSKCTCGAHQ